VIVAGLAVLAGIGAIFGATNNMYAAVQARTSEIGTLRALGFSRGSILGAFLTESVMTAGFAFAIGAVVSWLLAFGISAALGGIGCRPDLRRNVVLRVTRGRSCRSCSRSDRRLGGSPGGGCSA
jgi:ABC-type antimicrobial peptide transport system permease subunit